MKKVLLIVAFYLSVFQSLAFEDLAGGEYFWDIDPGYGKAIPILIPKDPTNDFLLDVSTSNLSYGSHTLGLRVKSAQNMWSTTQTQTVFIHTPSPSGDHSQITALEYFFETDLGFGKNKIIDITPKPNLNYETIEIPVPNNFNTGTYILNYRIKTGRNQWSATFSTPIAILPADANRGISKVELYFYLNDPGLDKAISIPISPINGKEVTVDMDFPLNFNSAGFTLLNFRAKDTQGNWSGLYTSRMDILAVLGIEENSNIEIYPNPTSSYIKIEIPEKQITVEVYNALGKMVKSFSSNPINNEYSIYELTAGIYYLKVVNAKENKLIGSYKLIKN